MKTDRGLALPDLINGAYEYIETINFKPHARIYLLDFLATTEYVVSSLVHTSPRMLNLWLRQAPIVDGRQ